MEFVDGVDLEALDKARRTDGRGTDAARRGSGLPGARGGTPAGIIHRDLKPSNVMLMRASDEQGDLVKVLDFGVAKFLREEGGVTVTVPTPRWAHPFHGA